MKNKLILLLLSAFGQKKPKRETSDRGFTLIEVIVAMVILSVFIVASLSALVAGLNFKLKSKLNNEATLIIQQDLEQVRYKSSYYGEIKTITAVPTLPATGLNTITGTTLPLAIPIADNGVRVSYTLDQALTIGGQSAVYKVTSNQPDTSPNPILTSLLVTVDLSKLNTIKKTTLASSLTLTSSTAISSITVTDASNIQVGDRIVIGPVTASTDIFVTTVTGVSGTTVSFASFTNTTTTKTFGGGTAVSILPRVNDVIAKTSTLTAFKDCTFSSTSTSSIATGFINQVVPNPTNSSTSLNGRTYQLTRAATTLSDTRVQLVYSVIEPTFSTTQSLAILTTEVIPSVTLQCTK